MKKTFLLIAATAAATACGSPQRNVRYTEHDNAVAITSFSTPNDLRLAFLRNKSDAVYCAEPMPDVALNSDASGSGSVAGSLSAAQSATMAASLSDENERLRGELRRALDKYERESSSSGASSTSRSNSNSLGQSASGSLNLNAAARLAVSVAELGGRTQQVLLAREFLYRICEARANNFFEGGQAYVELQTNALRLIESIAASQQRSSDAERALANAELLKQVNTYNTQQQTLCDERFKTCEAAATKEDEKKACAAARKQCVEAIKPLEAPAMSGDPKAAAAGSRGSNLPTPQPTK
ncbi:hypothetical protein WME98_51295 [Sorangium sp. So ce296]|uniref:hypothetical protein n=1 Tax=Sorangium sp. So ce296 TaxID=3133296 RepID=UPI003F62E4BF